MLTLSEHDIDSITSAIFQSAHLDLRLYAKSSLNRRLIRLADNHHLKSVDELKQFANSISDVDKFIEEITVNTTEMFRDPSFWKLLRGQILPELNGHETIRIWHAGCSTGEEVISMQILLEELKMRNKSQSFASDINLTVINAAKQSMYAHKHFALSEKNYQLSGGLGSLEDYISEKNENYFTFRTDLLSKVTFKRFDLVQDTNFLKFDLILCRNVLIYFDFELQELVIKKFISNLFSKGFISIGQQETIISPDLLNKLNTHNEAEKIYQSLQ